MKPGDNIIIYSGRHYGRLHRIIEIVGRFMDRLPDSLSARKEDLVTLLGLLPKDYPLRAEIRTTLELIHAHEREQMKFRELLASIPGGAK